MGHSEANWARRAARPKRAGIAVCRWPHGTNVRHPVREEEVETERELEAFSLRSGGGQARIEQGTRIFRRMKKC